MGSSGMKRKGRQHLPKVGTPSQRAYAQREEAHAVARNAGVRRGWMFWMAIVLVVTVVAFLLFGAFLWL